MRRRRLLTAVGASAAVACTATMLPSPPPTSTATPRATPSPTIPPTASATASPTPRGAPNWDQLRAAMRGQLYDGAGIGDTRLLYNTRFDAIEPRAIAQCRAPEDVQACVRFAVANEVPIAVRSGGHSYGGWSTGTGLVIDVSPMAAVSVGNGTVVAGAGARLIDAYDALASRGAGIAAGSCPTVGISGLTLGGGVGVLSRAWGLTCDQLTNIDIVTADGALHHCDINSDADLFWALRGGGTGGFGVVTALRFATHRAEPLALAFLTWPWSDAAAAVAGWQTWMRSAPDALWSTLHLEGGASGQSLSVHAVYPASAQAIAAEVTRLIDAVGRPPSYRESGVRTYRDTMLLEAGCLGRSVAACHLRGSAGGELGRETFAAKSIVAPGPMTPAATASLVGSVARARGGAAILIDALGGEVGRIAPDATAFPHRASFAVLQLYASWAAGSAGDTSLAWLRETHAAARPLIGLGAYANYADPDLADWVTAYYGTNYARLQQVKRKYDPGRVFDFPQAIVPA
jgi:FAD/FMN-containing dehydrogenase